MRRGERREARGVIGRGRLSASASRLPSPSRLTDGNCPYRHSRRHFRPHPFRSSAPGAGDRRNAAAGRGALHPVGHAAAPRCTPRRAAAAARDGAARGRRQSVVHGRRPGNQAQRAGLHRRYAEPSCGASVGSTRPLCLLLGADAFLELATWHRWHELFGLAHLIVAHRPGFRTRIVAGAHAAGVGARIRGAPAHATARRAPGAGRRHRNAGDRRARYLGDHGFGNRWRAAPARVICSPIQFSIIFRPTVYILESR